MNRFLHRTVTPMIAVATLIAASLANAGQDSPPSSAKPAAAGPLAFEVASIKLHDPALPGSMFHFLPSGAFRVEGATLRSIIMRVYKLRGGQIVGPDWIGKDRFDVNAKAEQPSSLNGLREMVQTMLANRFKLQFHHETKTMNLLVLLVDKPGKLKASEGGDPYEMATIQAIGPLKFKGVRASMPDLCSFIAGWTDRPVVLDKTGIEGYYDFTFTFKPEDGLFKLPPGVETPDYPDLYQAVKEQLGLKLESQKGPVEMFVIDHAEKPKEN
jgi:uncharacterized protein (TIGR03435 family)